MMFQSWSKKIGMLFDLYESCPGIEVREREIYFIKMKRTLKDFMISKEFKIEYIRNQNLSRLIAEVIRKDRSGSRYYSLQFFLKNALIKCLEIPVMPQKNIYQYLDQHLEFYLSLKLHQESYRYTFLIQKEHSSHLKLLLFVCKKDSSNNQLFDLEGEHDFSVRTINEMSTLLLAPCVYRYISGFYFHGGENYVKLVYHLGCLNELKSYPNNPNNPDKPDKMNQFLSDEDHRLIGISGEIPASDVLTHSNANLFSVSGRIGKHHAECRNALMCSLLLLFLIPDMNNTHRILPGSAFFRQKRKSIFFKTIILMYSVGVMFCLLNLLIQATVQEKYYSLDQSRLEHQFLIERKNKLILQQNQLEDLWTKYFAQQEFKNIVTKELYFILKSIPLNLKLSHLEIKRQKYNESAIQIHGYCMAQIELVNFLKNLRTSAKFRKVLLQQLQVIERKDHHQLPENGKQIIEFKVSIEI